MLLKFCILLVAILLSSSLATGQKNMSESNFSSAIVLIPRYLDTREVSTVDEYVILRHLNITLVKHDLKASIQGYLAQSWKISDDFKEYSFYLSDRFFSDGTPILAKDVVDSIRLQMAFGKTIHFDFNRILKIEEIDKKGVKFTLKEPDKYFLNQVRQPEFGILHYSQINREVGKSTFSVTSGPFSVKSRTDSNIALKRNRFFSDWINHSPEDFEFIAHNDTNIGELIKSKKLLSLDAMSTESIHNTEKEGYKLYQPRSSQTFFLALNGKSKWLQDEQLRRYLVKIVRQVDFSQNFGLIASRANQLFYPGGPSLLSPTELEALWSGIESTEKPKTFPKVLNFLSGTRGITPPMLKSALEKAGFTIERNSFESQFFDEALKKGDFDLVLISSDFASTELLENILVATGKGKPILLNSKSKIPALIAAAHEEFSGAKRQDFVKSIGFNLVHEGFVAPLVYFNRIYLVNPDYDTSNWSQFYPDVSIWRMPKLKK